MYNSLQNQNYSKWALFFRFLFMCLSFSWKSTRAVTFSNESDRQALFDFKNLITSDPQNIMSSWNESVHFCNWVGITCDPSSERVIDLSLNSLNLVGSMPSSIGNLTKLSGISLVDNGFHGEIPEEIGHLSNLESLDFSNNYFTGKIPTNLSNCTELTILRLKHNNFVGNVPDQLCSLSKLVDLKLGVNNLTGTIPPWIGNFSSLIAFTVARNNLQGSIPHELGRLTSLSYFIVFSNYLSGSIPPSIFNLSTLSYFTFAQNQLHGQLPSNVGLTLPRLQIFAGGVNNFTGSIPVSLLNASGIEVLDFSQNGLTGKFPTNMGVWKNLTRLNFDDNFLGNGQPGSLAFINSLVNCSYLTVLGLANNSLWGKLPSSIGNLSTQLEILTLGENLIVGSIPVGVKNLVNLISLGLEGNNLSGNIPDGFGKLVTLQGLYLSNNNLSGSIPSSLGDLSRLEDLSLQGNKFEGIIPPSLGNCKMLRSLNLSNNNLNGSIPIQIMGLSSLSKFLDLSHNSLSGSLPLEIGNLKNLMLLDLSDNKLSDSIPATLGGCVHLERLRLEGNSFAGEIPEALQNLRGLVELDVSRNELSGRIPGFLYKLSFLTSLNLSYNDFEGNVSTQGIFSNSTSVSVFGNNRLCGGIPELHLPPCSQRKSRNLQLVVILSAISAGVFLVVILTAFVLFLKVMKSRNKRPITLPPVQCHWQLISYTEILKSTGRFTAENLIGSGSFGSVYKGILSDETTVAIKVINLEQIGALKSFNDECNALRSIRHRNLVKTVSACSTIDYRGNDFKAIVFEYMPNGTLKDWLHPRVDQSRRLSLIQRLDIAIDVASALDYLHYRCEIPIAHCDLKPSNVLLDENLTAKVCDFGLARFLAEAPDDETRNKQMSIGVKGSVGYIPPEYGLGGQVSRHGDAYSYGILLLEMFTGKSPTNEVFNDETSLRDLVQCAFPDNVMEIVDPSIVLEERALTNTEINYPEPSTSGSKLEECIVSIMMVGLSCSVGSPGERMGMDLVVNNLQSVKTYFVKSQNPRR